MGINVNTLKFFACVCTFVALLIALAVDCGRSDDLSCYDKAGALHLKVAAIAVILISSSLGVTMPLLGQHFRFLKTEGNAFFIAKAFAAGIILATGFVHMLPDAASALTNSCLPDSPWSKFPFFGFFAMVAALGTLVVDFGATEFYERLQSRRSEVKALGDVPADADITHEHVHGHVGHTHGVGSISDEGLARIRHVVIAQVLELGIVAHSVIIGIALGVSNSPCTIRPLLAALSFHQFFEGFALGGCISQARYKMTSSAIMAFFFAVTTPGGIAVGIGISSSYNDNSPRALIVEGIFDSVSAGILVYMALVDLIAADFLSKRMRCNYQLQLLSYTALFLGAGAMSGIALWA
ncbi:unnamed protein product [Sphagnum jensenii]|uniref:Uncharacterized protein n=1 Tax=Sphagnum jensenii TaxID=128206 RepID=A0ABP1BYS7_9BRYO